MFSLKVNPTPQGKILGAHVFRPTRNELNIGMQYVKSIIFAIVT
jgi:hypothetical protein